MTVANPTPLLVESGKKGQLGLTADTPAAGLPRGGGDCEAREEGGMGEAPKSVGSHVRTEMLDVV